MLPQLTEIEGVEKGLFSIITSKGCATLNSALGNVTSDKEMLKIARDNLLKRKKIEPYNPTAKFCDEMLVPYKKV